jgi:hypothetical protein
MSCGACAIIPDYPAEKLDVIIAVEADDRETRAAIAARNNRMPVVVIPVPTQGRAPNRRRSTSRCRSRAAPSR